MNCPNIAPTTSIITWYTGKIIAILIGQNTHGETVDLSSPTSTNIGFASQTANEPVTENTINIIMNWRLDVIPNFSFKLFTIQN